MITEINEFAVGPELIQTSSVVGRQGARFDE